MQEIVPGGLEHRPETGNGFFTPEDHHEQKSGRKKGDESLAQKLKRKIQQTDKARKQNDLMIRHVHNKGMQKRDTRKNASRPNTIKNKIDGKSKADGTKQAPDQGFTFFHILYCTGFGTISHDSPFNFCL